MHGSGWIRTSEGVRQRVYSPSPLANSGTLPENQHFAAVTGKAVISGEVKVAQSLDGVNSGASPHMPKMELMPSPFSAPQQVIAGCPVPSKRLTNVGR